MDLINREEVHDIIAMHLSDYMTDETRLKLEMIDCKIEDCIPTVQAVPIEELQEIRQEIESNIESIIDKYDSNTPIRNLASYKVERNEGRKECLAIIDKYIKQIGG